MFIFSRLRSRSLTPGVVQMHRSSAAQVSAKRILPGLLQSIWNFQNEAGVSIDVL